MRHPQLHEFLQFNVRYLQEDILLENSDKFEEYKIILEYKKRLNEKELFVFENLTRHHVILILNFNQFDYQGCDLWIEVRFSNPRILTIKNIQQKNWGNSLKMQGTWTRIEVAEIIDISPNTLQMYEDGKE